MTENDYGAFANYLAGVGTTFGKGIEPLAIEIYFATLKDEFRIFDDFKAASVRLLKTWEYSYMPKPAHFINASRMNEDELEITARLAWSNIRESIRDGVGYTKAPVYDDPLTEYAVNAVGGMGELCCKDMKEMNWAEKDFIKIFKAGYLSRRIPTVKVRNNLLLETYNKRIVPPALRDGKIQLLEIAQKHKYAPQVENILKGKTKKI